MVIEKIEAQIARYITHQECLSQEAAPPDVALR